jgi:hypothetical protein
MIDILLTIFFGFLTVSFIYIFYTASKYTEEELLKQAAELKKKIEESEKRKKFK